MAIRKLNIGVYVANIFSRIHGQADDVALITTNPVAVKEMIDVCFKYMYSCKWQLIINPDKTVMMQWESKKGQQHEWYVGQQKMKVLVSHTYCGIFC